MWNEQDPDINGAQWPVIHFFFTETSSSWKSTILRVWQSEGIRIAISGADSRRS